MANTTTHSELEMSVQATIDDLLTQATPAVYRGLPRLTPTNPGIIISTTILILLGITGNTLNILVFVTMKSNAVFHYLIALSTFDLTFCLAYLFNVAKFFMGEFSSNYSYIWFYGYVIYPLQFIMPVLAACTTLIICITRFVMVKFPMKSTFCSHKSTSSIILAVMTVVVVLLRAPPIYTCRTIRTYQTTTGQVMYRTLWNAFFFSPAGKSLWLAQAAIFEHSLIILDIISSVLMVITLHQHNAKVAPSLIDPRHLRHQQEKQLILMVTSIILLETLCRGPTSLVRLLEMPSDINSVMMKVTNQLFILNRCANFYMYTALQKWFRLETLKILRRIAGKKDESENRSDTGTGNRGTGAKPGTQGTSCQT